MAGENNIQVLADITEYATRYGYDALGHAILNMARNNELHITQEQACGIWEFGGSTAKDDEPKEKQKFTFRFHTHGWTDITVEAENAEEAAELASDKYNEGDYDDSDSDFENTDMENVTDYYVNNSIPQ